MYRDESTVAFRRRLSLNRFGCGCFSREGWNGSKQAAEENGFEILWVLRRLLSRVGSDMRRSRRAVVTYSRHYLREGSSGFMARSRIEVVVDKVDRLNEATEDSRNVVTTKSPIVASLQAFAI